MSDYQVTTVTVSSLKDKLTLPKFQRGYVWNNQKKVDLIDSLHKGYPFGSLLTYQQSISEKEQLLDGQQRWSTILDYKANNSQYWKRLNKEKYELGFNTINSWITDTSKIEKDDYDNVLSGREDLADWADEKIQNYSFGDKTAKDLRNEVRKYKKMISEYLLLEDIQIPIIRYTGDEANIAQVFENLNKGGVQLTKFEIFAAAWSHTEINLENTQFQNEILNEVKIYYLNKQDKVEDFGFDLEGFSEDEFTNRRVINLFELGLAIGMFTKSRLPGLVTDNEKNINEIGFGLLGISSDVDPKNLNKLLSRLDYIGENLELILSKIDKISGQLSHIFDKMISQNTNINNAGIIYQRGLNTTYKTLSYFAALWEANFETEKSLLSNIPSYYIFDSLSKVWGNAGDSRLFDYYPSQGKKSYALPVNKQDFLYQFNQWLENDNTQTERFSNDVKALVTIHANLTYLSAIISIGEPFQFEHIYPKARIRTKDVGRAVLLGNLGNCMYLPKSVNQNKKTKVLYDLNNGEDYKKLIKESSYPSREDFTEAFKNLDSANFGNINSLILKRANTVINQIIDELSNPF